MTHHPLAQRLRRHPLIDLLFSMRGNPKVLMLIEPLWGIPYNLIAPYATVYMYALGVSVLEIGTLLSVTMVVQLIASFAGGVISDKFGRKFTTMLGDFFGWTLPCIIWAISQNVWFFLIAMVFNCFEQVNQTAWYCLLVEDAEKEKIVNIFTWISIAGLIAVFFAPISGLLVTRFSVVPVARVLYAVFAITMLFKNVITWRYAKETQQGKIRMAETKEIPIRKLLLEYRQILPLIFKNKATLQTLCIMVILHITSIIQSTYFGLYVTEALGIEQGYLSLFPIIRAAIMIVFMFAVQHRIKAIKIPICVGLGCYLLAQAFLLFAPRKQLALIVFSLLAEAFAYALVFPRKDALVVQNVNPQERARIIALMTALMTLFAAPFGYLSGLLSSQDPRLPFCLSALLFLLALGVITHMKERRPSADAAPEN